MSDTDDRNLADWLGKVIAAHGWARTIRTLAILARDRAIVLDAQDRPQAARMVRGGSGLLDDAAPFFDGSAL